MADESAFGVDKAAEKAAKAEDTPEPTHDLLLSNWTVVPHFGAIPTHYAKDDRVFAVLSATER